jgi:hypothetical protein
MTELEYAYLFYKKAPGIIGRKATYEELFWAAFETWTKRMETYTRPENQGNYNVCITECRSAPLFRMYVAFQFIEPRRMQNDEWKSFLGEVCEIAARGVAGCYEAIPRKSTIFNVTVLQTNDFVEHVGGVERGVHLVWPNLIVDESTALRLVTTIELMLTASGPCRVDGQNTYEDAVDTTVYRFGLRLPGCPKSELCSICGGNRSQMSKSIRRPNDEYESYANRLARFCPDHRKFPVGYGFRRETAYGIKDIVDGTGISLPQPEWERLTGSAYIYRDKSHNTRVFNFTIKELASIRTTATEATPGFKARGDIERLLKNLDENDIRICSRYDLKTDTKCKSPRGVKRKLLVGKRLTLTV